MKIVVVNSNSSQSVTDTIAKAASATASNGTDILAATAEFGPTAIEGRADATVAAHATLETIGKYSKIADAAVIACFSDPGLLASREAYSIPITGIAEASMLTACMLGNRFSVVTVAPSTVEPIRALAFSYGLRDRLASVRAIERGVLDSHANPDQTRQDLQGLVEDAVAKDGAEVIILGGAITAGMAKQLAYGASVPILDCVECAVRQAELLVHTLGRNDEK